MAFYILHKLQRPQSPDSAVSRGGLEADLVLCTPSSKVLTVRVGKESFSGWQQGTGAVLEGLGQGLCSLD